MWKPIKIYRLQDDADKYGNCCMKKVLCHSCKAEINCVGGKEYYAARQINAENEVTFKIRFCRAVKEIKPQEYLIEYDSQEYDIQYVDNFMMSNDILKIKAVARNENRD